MVITDEELPAWRHGLQAGIDSEREEIVEWLRGLHWTHRDYEAARRLADAIESRAAMPVPD